MRKHTMTLGAALLVLGAMTATASAQAPILGASPLGEQLKNATPVIKQAACNGTTGVYGCGPGWIWRCNRWGHRCRCVPCW
jgi:hypothetical protein